MAAGVGYWRESDGSSVTRDQAEAAWADAAHRRLGQLARSYHATIEYGQLAEEIQTETGIRSTVPMRHWIGGLLGQVADRGQESGEPPLTALVVQKDSGMVGEGYDYVLRIGGLEPIHDPAEREDHAARARIECYKWAGVNEPSDGWRAALAPALQRKRQWAATKATPPPVAVTCPTCWTALPATGICDNCG